MSYARIKAVNSKLESYCSDTEIQFKNVTLMAKMYGDEITKSSEACIQACQTSPDNHEVIRELRDKVKSNGRAFMALVKEWRERKITLSDLPSHEDCLASRQRIKEISDELNAIPYPDSAELMGRPREYWSVTKSLIAAQSKITEDRIELCENIFRKPDGCIIQDYLIEACKLSAATAVKKADAILNAPRSGTAYTLAALTEQQRKASFDTAPRVVIPAKEEKEAYISAEGKAKMAAAHAETKSKAAAAAVYYPKSVESKDQKSAFSASGSAVMKAPVKSPTSQTVSPLARSGMQIAVRPAG